MKIRLILTGLFIGLALAGCTTGQTIYYPDTNGSTAKKAKPKYVMITGSRIPQRVDPDNPNKDTMSPVTVLSADEYRDMTIGR